MAGHCLTKGSQMQRTDEAVEVSNLGHEIYNPQDNKEINDKAALKDEPLAEKIVKHDTDAIKWADTVVIEPLPEACGTMVELGQIHGMKMLARMIQDELGEEKNMGDMLTAVDRMCTKILDQEVYPHMEDIRRVEGITETGDRRSLGINQYIYGVCLDLTSGKGFYDWNEIMEKLDD